METLDSLHAEQLEERDVVSYITDDGTPDTIQVAFTVDEIDTVRIVGHSIITGDVIDDDFLYDFSFDYHGKAEEK